LVMRVEIARLKSCLQLVGIVTGTLILCGGQAAAQGLSSHNSARCMLPIEYHLDSIRVGGRAIRIERFEPKRVGKYPIVILIHGSGGLLTHTGSEMPREENFGEMRIACAGYVSLLVHYFDLNGILDTTDKDYMQNQFPGWLEVLERTVDYAFATRKGDSKHIGIFGESLGGYLALSLAMQDKRIKSVSEYGGGLRMREGDDTSKLPPVLIQHGAADTIVPVEEAIRLAKVLSEQSVRYTIKIYEGLNHYPSANFREQVEELSIDFFEKTLKSKSTRRPRSAEDESTGP
jgi:carboxymethylenebutenolidase